MSAASDNSNAYSLLACVLFVVGIVVVSFLVARRRATQSKGPKHRQTGRGRHGLLRRRRARMAERFEAGADREADAGSPRRVQRDPPPGGASLSPVSRRRDPADADTLDLEMEKDLPTDRLLARADAALVAADNARCTSEQELAFAQAQHGRDATLIFAEAVTAARADVAEAFRIRQGIDEHEPEDELSRRRMLRDIVDHCAAADRRLDAQSEPFERLRAQEESALPARLTARRDDLRGRLALAGTTWKELTAAYAESALAPIADNIAQAAARVEFASREIDENGRRTGLRSAQLALGQADALLDALDTFAADLAAAEDAAAELLADLHAEVAAGKAVLAMAGRPPGNARGDKVGLAADVARADQVANELAVELAAPRPDPMMALRRLEDVSGPLGESLGAVRDPSSRVSHAKEQLDQAMFSARATIDAATGFLLPRRGAVGARARIRLFAARTELDQAVAATETEPVEALVAARAAQSLATQALAAARADVAAWSDPVVGYEGALLGGIVYAPTGTGRPYGARFGGPGARDRDRAA